LPRHSASPEVTTGASPSETAEKAAETQGTPRPVRPDIWHRSRHDPRTAAQVTTSEGGVARSRSPQLRQSSGIVARKRLTLPRPHRLPLHQGRGDRARRSCKGHLDS
jgi:hypothetical protein